MPARVTSRDHGYDALFRRLAGKTATVTVGVHEDVGAQPHEGREGSGEPPTIADVATWLEFGTRRAPRRSIVADWADERIEENKQLLRKVGEGVVTGAIASQEEGCRLLGEKLKGSMVRRAGEGIMPENAPSTIARKGSSTPGIDTGQVRKAIDFKVTER